MDVKKNTCSFFFLCYLLLYVGTENFSEVLNGR